MAQKKAKKKNKKVAKKVSRKWPAMSTVARAAVDYTTVNFDSINTLLGEVKYLVENNHTMLKALMDELENIKPLTGLETARLSNVQGTLFDKIPKEEKSNGETLISKSELMNELKELGAVHGVGAIGAIVKKHGANRIGELAQSNYAAVLAEAKAL